MTLIQFKNSILEALKNKPKEWRDGQFVFNYIESKYGQIAREVQFIDKTDCFYDDSKIESFIVKTYYRLWNILL